eukprot:jgi/Chrpa1/25956/Chrysochromulina_OHIO_Genome00025731-RA
MQGVLLHDVEALQSENVPNELDLRILAHLADIQLAIKTHTDDALDERDTVHLVLVFRPNEFLEPGFETLECAFDRVKGQLKSTSGLEIRWRDGKAPTIEGSLSFFDVFAKVGDFAQQAEEKAAVTKELLALIEEVLLHNSISQGKSLSVALITGGGTGIGRAVALRLAAGGWQREAGAQVAIVLTGRRADVLEETAREIRKAHGEGVHVLVHAADLTLAADVKGLFNAVASNFGRLDLLFNNAGTNVPPTTFDKMEYADWRRVININLDAAFHVARDAYRMM